MRAEVMAWRTRIETIRRRLEDTILFRIWERLLENEFLDRSVALGAKAFVSLFPSLIVVAAFTPPSVRDSIITTLTRRIGLSGDGLTTVQQAFASSEDTRRATGVIGLLFTFFYISSFTTALRRVYTRAWRRPRGGFASGKAVGVGFLVGLAVYFALIGSLRSVFGSGPATGLFVVVTWATSAGLWLITPWLMLGRQVRWRALIPSAVLTSTASLSYAASSSVWMPRAIAENQQQFGFFGVALSLVTWLTGAATIIVVCACAAPVLAEDRGWIGRMIRGPGSDALVEGAEAATPAPASAPGLARAFGIRGRGTAPEAADDDDVR